MSLSNLYANLSLFNKYKKEVSPSKDILPVLFEEPNKKEDEQGWVERDTKATEDLSSEELADYFGGTNAKLFDASSYKFGPYSNYDMATRMTLDEIKRDITNVCQRQHGQPVNIATIVEIERDLKSVMETYRESSQVYEYTVSSRPLPPTCPGASNGGLDIGVNLKLYPSVEYIQLNIRMQS